MVYLHRTLFERNGINRIVVPRRCRPGGTEIKKRGCVPLKRGAEKTWT